MPEWLAEFVIDINRAAPVKLAIMDAVIGMEGDGPSGGDPLGHHRRLEVARVEAHQVAVIPGDGDLVTEVREQQPGR